MAQPPASEEEEAAALPPELLQEICGKLPSIIDYIQFRSVCRSWRSAAIPAFLPPQLPWLMLPYNPRDEHRRFFCPSTHMIHRLRLTGTRNKRICGSGHGWLALTDYDSNVITLINPLTRYLIHLPPSGFKGRMVISAALSTSPTSASDCIVGFITRHSTKLAFCCLSSPSGVSSWCVMDTGLTCYANYVAFHRDKLCVLDGRGSVAICDTRLKTAVIVYHEEPLLLWPDWHQPAVIVYHEEPLLLWPDWHLANRQIVESSEELLLVTNYKRFVSVYEIIDYFLIYRLDYTSQKPSWVLTKTIHDRVVYRPIFGPIGQFMGYREWLCYMRYMKKGEDEILNLMVLDMKKGVVEQQNFKNKCWPFYVQGETWIVPSLV